MKSLLIYIAGAYAGNTDGKKLDYHDIPAIIQHNVDLAIDAGIQILRKGHVPYVPHLTHYINLRVPLDNPIKREQWYEIDNVVLPKCDALFYLSSSRGADAELELAKKNGLYIFYSLEEIYQV